ncbi:hypothetical protein JCM12298_26110 [Desulfothermus naphthae]
MSNCGKLFLIHLLSSIFVFFFSIKGFCAFHEQLAISTKAVSLANAVTANPPGIMSIHYNPAGLSLLKPDKWFYFGLTLPYIKKTSKFDRNPDWPGIFGGFKDDPILDKNGHAEGTNTSGKMFLPIINQPINFLIGPSAGIAYKPPGSKWSFAIGSYPPFAVGLIHGHRNDPVRWGGWEVYQQHLIYAAPSVSYQIKDNLSIGLSVGLGQTAMGAQVDMRAPNELVSLTRVLANATEGLEIPVMTELTLPQPWFYGGVGPYDKMASLNIRLRDDYSPNYNIGILWSPYKWLSLGVCYQSPIKVQLRGKYIIKYSKNWQQMIDWFGSSPLLVSTAGMLDLPIHSVPSERGRLTTEIEFPQRVQAGIKLTLFQRLNLMFDVKWTNWSVLDQDNFRFDKALQLFRVAKISGYLGGNYNLILKRDFKDTLDWAVGFEYLLNDKITLRAGYEWRETPVRDNHFDLLYALPDLHFFGVGASIKLPKKITLDVGGAYIFNKGYKVPDNSSKNLNSNIFTDVVYNPYAGMDYEQDTEVYMLSLSATMPFETLKELNHEQRTILKKAGSMLMFFKAKKKGEKQVYIEKVKKFSKIQKLHQETETNKTENIEKQDLVVKIPKKIIKSEEQIKDLINNFITCWKRAELDKFISFYAPYAIKGNLIGRKAIYNWYKRLWSKNKPDKISISNLHIKKNKRGYWVEFIQKYEAKKGYKDTGITTLYIEKIDDSFKILYHYWKKLDLHKLKAKYVPVNHQINEDKIKNFVYKWKNSWKAHNLKDFIKFYSPYAVKRKLIGRSNILNYYKKLWARDYPKNIYIANINIKKANRGYLVEFIQKYISQKGYKDLGITTLIIEDTKEGLKIINHQFRPLKDKRFEKLFDTFIKWIELQKMSNLNKQTKLYAPYVVTNKGIGIKTLFSLYNDKKLKEVEVRDIYIQHQNQRWTTEIKMIYKYADKEEEKEVLLCWERVNNSWKIIVHLDK